MWIVESQLMMVASKTFIHLDIREGNVLVNRTVLSLLDKYSFCWGDCCEFIAPDV